MQSYHRLIDSIPTTLTLSYHEISLPTKEEHLLFDALRRTHLDLVQSDTIRERIFIYYSYVGFNFDSVDTVFRFEDNSFIWKFTKIDWEE